MSVLDGPAVNASAIVLGGVIGGLAGARLGRDFRDLALRTLGLVVVVIGFQMVWPMPSPLVLLLSLVGGAWIGTAWHLDARLHAIGEWVESRIHADGSAGWASSFVAASLVFNVGALAILGSVQAGLGHVPSLLYTKAALDGVTGMILAATLGWGVIGAAVVTLAYEGGIALLAKTVSAALPHGVLASFSAVGGILIAAIGLNFIVGRQVVKVANLLPALALAIGLAWIPGL